MAKNYTRGPVKRAYMRGVSTVKRAIGPQMPGNLPQGAQRIWKQLVPHIRKGTMALTPADGPMLADLVLALYRLGQCEEAIERDGIIVDGRRNPALLAAGPYREQIARLAAKFGMTPGDRARQAPAEAEVQEKSVADILFEGALAGAEHE